MEPRQEPLSSNTGDNVKLAVLSAGFLFLLCAGVDAQVELEPSFTEYFVGEEVRFTVSNSTDIPIHFLEPVWFVIVDLGGLVVFAAPVPLIPDQVDPGFVVEQTWDQLDEFGIQVPVDTYIIEVVFHDLINDRVVVLNHPIGIGIPPAPGIEFNPLYFPTPNFLASVSGSSSGCGSVGIDLLLLPLALAFWRRRLRRRANPSPRGS